MRSEWTKGHLLHQSYWTKKYVSKVNESVAVKHTRGKPITKEEKQLCLNVFQSYLDDGRDYSHAVCKTALRTKFPQIAIAKMVKEKTSTGTVKDNNRKFRSSQTMFEKLSESQIKR